MEAQALFAKPQLQHLCTKSTKSGHTEQSVRHYRSLHKHGGSYAFDRRLPNSATVGRKAPNPTLQSPKLQPNHAPRVPCTMQPSPDNAFPCQLTVSGRVLHEERVDAPKYVSVLGHGVATVRLVDVDLSFLPHVKEALLAVHVRLRRHPRRSVHRRPPA